MSAEHSLIYNRQNTVRREVMEKGMFSGLYLGLCSIAPSLAGKAESVIDEEEAASVDTPAPE